MKSIYEYVMKNNELDQLKKSADAMVVSSKQDHKFIFLKNNPKLPSNLIPDKKRHKNKMYKKGNTNIYFVIVDMFEHPTIKAGDGDLADIWVVDNLKQAQEQLDIMIKRGAKQFKFKIKVLN